MIEEVTAQPSNFLFIKKIPLEMPEFHVGEAFVIVYTLRTIKIRKGPKISRGALSCAYLLIKIVKLLKS